MGRREDAISAAGRPCVRYDAPVWRPAWRPARGGERGMPRANGLIVVAVVVLVGVALAGPPAAVLAQAFPITPDPAACRVAPRATDEVIALWYGTEGSP